MSDRAGLGTCKEDSLGLTVHAQGFMLTGVSACRCLTSHGRTFPRATGEMDFTLKILSFKNKKIKSGNH